MTDLTGCVLQNRYRIDAHLGRGGMAEVYRAFDTRRLYAVAIKVMHADLAEDIEFLNYFRREAESLSRLAHGNIVRFYEFQREGFLAFLVMDYVDGITLRQRILEANGSLPLAEIYGIVQQVCVALHYAHEEGIIHRDVKPANIMLRTDGRVLVTDFGIAKITDAATLTIHIPGTPAYMSPEQCQGEMVDRRSDVYALGVVVYELLTGYRPFGGKLAPATVTGGTRERIRWEQIHIAPPPLHLYNPTLPRQAEAVVLKALAKEPAERWPSALAFWQALAEVLGTNGPEAVAEPVTVPSATHWAAVRPAVPPSSPVMPLPAAIASPQPQPTPSRVWPVGRMSLGVVGLILVGLIASLAVRRINQTQITATVLAQEVALAQATATMQAQVTTVFQDQMTATVQAGGTATTQAGETTTAQASETAIAQVGETATADALATTTVQAGKTTTAQTAEMGTAQARKTATAKAEATTITHVEATTTAQTKATMTTQVETTTTAQAEVMATPQVARTVTTRATATSVPTPVSVHPQAPRLVLGNYFPWFDDDGWDDCNISANDKPLQPYNSDDPEAIERHIQMALDIGLDGFTSHWFAPDDRTDNNFNTLLTRSQGYDFHSTIVFSRHIWDGSPAPTQQNIVEAIRYVMDSYSAHPNFFHLAGKPVLFFTDIYRIPVEEEKKQQFWADIRAEVDPQNQAWWIGEGLDFGYLAVFDGIHQYKITHADYPDDYKKEPRWAIQVRQWEQQTGKPKLWVATITPGWNDLDANCGRPDVRAPVKLFSLDREDGAFYQATFASALESNPDWLWIHSFNEWVEGTYIEPSELYGDKYMQMTQEFVNTFKAR